MRRLLILGVVLGLPDGAIGQGFAPAEATRRMTVPDGFGVTLIAAEPQVRQPILVKYDDRGRLWVIQYLQYPNPAGLKRVTVDRWSRAVYDHVPPPPPHGPRGADRITILEDSDGDGRADQFHDFVGGLNLATGLAFGHGGVFVLQVPYLLFYPDANHDDLPDSDPRVLLRGFGMEDAQSLANHLTWGPDGWLYGVNGSTTTCQIRGITFQQGVWRYHPVHDTFELFCEGGGNLYGLTFDRHGQLFFSSNHGMFFHAAQGGYFEKNLAKHGPIHNPYAYGMLGIVEHEGDAGRPMTGGTVYLGHTFPPSFRDAVIAGSFLGQSCSWWSVNPKGASVQARLEGLLLKANDSWFQPTDVCLAPDGSIVVCDFYDRRTAHPDPDADWDRSNGRVYKVSYKTNVDFRSAPNDIRTLSNDALFDLLGHPNGWYADRAQVELAGRRDLSAARKLMASARETDNADLALRYVWAGYVSGGWTDALALELLSHPNEHVRAWSVRFIGDEKTAAPTIADRLVSLAENETSPVVLAQLAASAKRLPPEASLPIVFALCHHATSDDERTDWLLWWALEANVTTHTDRIVEVFRRADLESGSWRRQLGRLVRRLAAEGDRSCYDACATLCERPGIDLRSELLRGLADRSATLPDVGQGELFANSAVAPSVSPPSRKIEPVEGPLADFIRRAIRAEPTNPVTLELALRAELPESRNTLLENFSDSTLPQSNRRDYLRLAREFADERFVRVLLEVLENRPESEGLFALDALSPRLDPKIARRLLELYPALPVELRLRIHEVLLQRAETCSLLLQAIEAGDIDPEQVPLRQVRLIAPHKSEEFDSIVRKYWGRVAPGTPEEKLARMRRYSNDLRAGSGDPQAGAPLFEKHCATCHRLRGIGTMLGPDLTGTVLGDTESLLASLVDPSAVIRREYLSQIVETNDGALHTGIVVAQDAATITLADEKNRATKLRHDEIAARRVSALSLMPENLLDTLTPQQLRDLFAYLKNTE